VAQYAYEALGCRDWAHINLRLGVDGIPHVVGVDTVPLVGHPVLQAILTADGRGLDVLKDVLQLAVERESAFIRSQVKDVEEELDHDGPEL
jgi:hypothetical protein